MPKNSIDSASLLKLQNEFAYHFRDTRLLEQALTHSSWAHAQGKPLDNNERLEFLGDAVLELCVSDMLFQNFPEAREGALTAMRARLVNGRALFAIAESLDLLPLLRKSIGEEWQGEKQRQSLGADALEAIIGAIYLDGGFHAARRAVDSLLARNRADFEQRRQNPKNALQEETMRMFHELPKYETVAESGPEHAKTFQVRVKLPDGSFFSGDGSNRKNAEKMAAEKALAALQSQNE